MNKPRLAFTDLLYQDATWQKTSSHYTGVCFNHRLQLRKISLNYTMLYENPGVKFLMSLCTWNSCTSPEESVYSLDDDSTHLGIISIFVLVVTELRTKHVAHLWPIHRASEWAFGSIVTLHALPFLSLALPWLHFPHFVLCYVSL